MTRPPEDTDDNIVLDAQDDDWAWRRRIRAHPTTRRLYRGAVGVVGAVVLVVGLVAVPAPGPGWLIVFVGLAILASEFEFAQRLLRWGRARLEEWNTWLRTQPWWVAGLVGLGTASVVAVVFWGFFAWSGTPGWLPDQVEAWLQVLPGV
ncbi:MAG: TIGR02611 family protein [Lapillicoccus sp.]